MENGQRYRAKLSVRLGVTFSRQKRIFHHVTCFVMYDHGDLRMWRREKKLDYLQRGKNELRL